MHVFKLWFEIDQFEGGLPLPIGGGGGGGGSSFGTHLKNCKFEGSGIHAWLGKHLTWNPQLLLNCSRALDREGADLNHLSMTFMDGIQVKQ